MGVPFMPSADVLDAAKLLKLMNRAQPAPEHSSPWAPWTGQTFHAPPGAGAPDSYIDRMPVIPPGAATEYQDSLKTPPRDPSRLRQFARPALEPLETYSQPMSPFGPST